MKNKGLFTTCEHCDERCYEHSGVLETDDVLDFKIFCPSCKKSFDWRIKTGKAIRNERVGGKPQGEVGILRALLNPKVMAHMVKKVRHELDEEGKR